MTCKGCAECLLKLLNFLLTLLGLAMLGYGIYLLVEFTTYSAPTISPTSSNSIVIELARPMLGAMSLSSSFLHKLSEAWFIYTIIGIGLIIFVVSCFGCIGAATRNSCCLTFYSVLVLLLILVELGCAAFIYFDKSWNEVIPYDKTGDFTAIYDFVKQHWVIMKWTAFGAVVLEAVIFLLALVVRAANRTVTYDSDDDIIAARQARQPLLPTWQSTLPASSGIAAGPSDRRPPARKDAWSTRMREKYGLDTSEFTYNPSEPSPETTAQPEEDGGSRLCRCRCNVM